MINEEIINKSIKIYGSRTQSIVCMEECSELIQAISKELRGKNDKEHLTEEMADVYICLKMLEKIYGIEQEDIEKWIEKKQKRTAKRMLIQ